MVKNPRTPARTRPIKPLNAPTPIRVRTDTSGRLTAVHLSRSWQTVTSVEDLWKIDDEWWRGTDHRIQRTYFDLLLQTGTRITLFHDLTHNTWHRQSP